MQPSLRSLALLAVAVVSVYLALGMSTPASSGAERTLFTALGEGGGPLEPHGAGAILMAKLAKLAAEKEDDVATIARLKTELAAAGKNAGKIAVAAATLSRPHAPNGYDPMPAVQRIRIVTAAAAAAAAAPGHPERRTVALSVAVKTAKEIWAAGGPDNTALAVMTAATYPGIGDGDDGLDGAPSRPHAGNKFTAQIMDARAAVARWGHDGVFVGLFAREYNNRRRDRAARRDAGSRSEAQFVSVYRPGIYAFSHTIWYQRTAKVRRTSHCVPWSYNNLRLRA